jgi:hypothetical protein
MAHIEPLRAERLSAKSLLNLAKPGIFFKTNNYLVDSGILPIIMMILDLETQDLKWESRK